MTVLFGVTGLFGFTGPLGLIAILVVVLLLFGNRLPLLMHLWGAA